MYPLLEKLQSIKTLSVPNHLKKLGLTGCYQKFIPAYADFVWPLIQLTYKTVPYVWMDQCQKASETLKDVPVKSPILVYPDPKKPYTLVMGALKYTWFTVITQEHATIIYDKITIHQHSITYITGLSQGSQLNWVTLV